MKLFILIFLFCLTFFANCADKISFMSYNCYNYFVEADADKLKSEESKKALVNVIKKANPDVLLIYEIGTKESLDDLMKHLKKVGCKYIFGKVMKGYDRRRHLGVISKIKPQSIIVKDNIYYNISPKDPKSKWLETRAISRGFLHSIFVIDNYKIHTISAHLKSKLPHSRYNQAEMRRLEARQLRYYINDLMKLEPDANILVLGDMNDTPDSDPIKTLSGYTKNKEKILYDLRPMDLSRNAWTHWWKYEDSYSRIDYIFANYNLIPEIDIKKNFIIYDQKASDHRALIVNVFIGDKKLFDEKQINLYFNDKKIRRPIR